MLQRARAQGGTALAWVQGLGALIAELEHDWGIAVGATLYGGTGSFVAEARTAAGEEAVLKVGMPAFEPFAHEIRVVAIADGRGYARLLRHDETRNAALLERLGPRLSELGLPIRTQIEIICATLRSAWAPISPNEGFITGAEKAVYLSNEINRMWRELGKPCSARVIDAALAYAENRRRAFDPRTAVLVHGDAHSANTLKVLKPEDTEFKFIDPDGLFAERAYDLAIPMREWSEELLAGDALRLGQERCALLSELTDIDPQAIWEWGFIERVSTGLLCLTLGFEEWGRASLEVAEAWAKP